MLLVAWVLMLLLVRVLVLLLVRVVRKYRNQWETGGVCPQLSEGRCPCCQAE